MIADAVSYSAVRVYSADGSLIRVISVAELRSLTQAKVRSAPPVERAAARAFYPSVSPTSRRKPHTPVRRQKQAA